MYCLRLPGAAQGSRYTHDTHTGLCFGGRLRAPGSGFRERGACSWTPISVKHFLQGVGEG
jgi:hypothetical protein